MNNDADDPIDVEIEEPKVKKVKSIKKRLEQLGQAVADEMVKKEPQCKEHEPNEKWVCNRKLGHGGQHVAIADRVLAVWE